MSDVAELVLADTKWQYKRGSRPRHGWHDCYRVVAYSRMLEPEEVSAECRRLDPGGQIFTHPVTLRGRELAHYVADDAHVQLANFEKAQVYWSLCDSGD